MPEKDTAFWALAFSVMSGIIAGIFGYGKVANQVKSNTKDLEILENKFKDPEHTHRLLTLGDHDSICKERQANINQRLDTICQKLEVRDAKDDAINLQLTAIQEMVKIGFKKADEREEKK